MRTIQRRRKRRQGGHAVIEVALMAPWIYFLFVGAFDFGFFHYATISTENAARIAALYASESQAAAKDVNGACREAVRELRFMPDVGPNAKECGDTAAVKVMLRPIETGLDGRWAVAATVQYTTPNLIPIPGLLNGKLVINRSVEMRVREAPIT